ncbi:hypothetical protein [Mucilaginibacter terrae]|uniref:hypothetical protein n=1 Tax=Mucilaginibacter terrae TaxID=1955052 RepID=UPI00289A1C4B|nr:hypothetical protein [Mucilaginibacter terrae]
MFMHAEIWCDRNRRPMGLFHALPFLSRFMNREELEYHHFNTRLCYHQYEDWDKLLFAEQQEADELDREKPGTGTEFLKALAGFRSKYPLGQKPVSEEMDVPVSEDSGLGSFLDGLMTGDNLSAAEISALMEKERAGEQRPAVLVLLRELYKNTVLPPDEQKAITGEVIDRKVWLSEERSRKNFVRRVYTRNKLFALAEIREKYPDYSEVMLMADLKVKKGKLKAKKHKPVLDLRRCQLEKLAQRLRSGVLDDAAYHATCCKIVMLQQAHDLRLPIPLTVTFSKQSLVYYFNWRTRESVVKAFVELANTKGMTHEVLKIKYQEMVDSNYSY